MIVWPTANVAPAAGEAIVGVGGVLPTLIPTVAGADVSAARVANAQARPCSVPVVV